MKIGLVHFSDIHFKESVEENPILKKTDKIISALQNRIGELDLIFLIISGDIAYSGKQLEYRIATNFLSQIKKELIEYSKKKIFILVVPGNHDCDFQNPLKSRDLILSGLEARNFAGLDPDIISLCCSPQKEYFTFQHDIIIQGGTVLFENELLNIIEYEQDGVRIIFNCFNTSWTSTKTEQEGKITFPINYFGQEVFNDTSTVKVNIIHHPINWQSITAHREFRKFLNANGDITLSGHEHQFEITKMVDSSDNSNIYFESAALQDSSNNLKSFFNLISINIDTNNIKANLFEFKKGLYNRSEILKERQFLDYTRNQNNQLPLSIHFSNYLESLSAQFLHKRVDKIFIDDIFVSPFLKTMDESTGKIKIINFNDIIYKKKDNKTIIIGDEGSGKTTLCKKIFKEYYEKGHLPVLIKGSKIEKSTFDYIYGTLLKDAYVDQYHRKILENFEEIDKNKIVIIIDDLQACKLKENFRKAFVTLINDQFKNVIYTSDSMLYFSPIAEGDGIFGDFETFTIVEFSYELRYEIIKKWNALGESEIVGNDILRKNELHDQLVKNFLGTNFLPHYPFIIITALQSIDFSNSSEQGFSYYYRFLIEESLKKSIYKNDDLLFYNYFLAEYCYFLFEERIRTVSKESFEDYFKKYTKRKKVTLSFKDVFSQLISSKTIRIESDFVSISYNYIYYYYVATYLASNIDDSDIKALIKKLIERLYVDEFSNIIIFLTQISSSKYIIDTIKNHSNEYFKDFAPATLSKDIENIDKLMRKIPELVFEDRDIEERRKREIKKRDLAQDQERKVEEHYLSKEYNLKNDISTISLLNSFIRAIKTFEIFGQIIKKNWGAYDGDIKELFVNSTFNLSMRVLSAYFNLLQKSETDLIEHIYYIADKKEITDKNEIEKLATNFIFQLAYITSYGIIKRVSNSISHYQLRETFDDIISKNPNNANKLIRLSIIMDHFGVLPNDEINILFNKDKGFNKFFLPKMILQNFIHHYLHMYEVPYDERNKICSIAGIKIKEQRSIQDTSNEMK